MRSPRPSRKRGARVNVRALLDHLARPRIGVPMALLFGGLVSLARGVDTNWDLRNYHFYNPWAWLQGRMSFDIAPAQAQSYYSPLLDVPFYALVASKMPAFAITFLMGLPFGVAAWFFYRIARDAVHDLGVEREGRVLAVVGVVALTGAAGFSQIGSTMNEWTTAALVMAALFVVVGAVRSADPPRLRVPPAAGLLCGVAAGLKLTAAIYAIALPLAFALCFRGRRRHTVATLAFVAATGVGFALAYGYWAFVLWERFGNPFFPYFNELFRSEYWDARPFFDTRFRPTTLAHWITLPFALAERNRLASEADLRDPRLALLIVFAVVLAASRAREARAAGGRMAAALFGAIPPSIRFLAVFAAASYAAWLVAFTVYRFAIPLELVASLLLVLAMHAAFVGAVRRDVLIGIAALAVVAVTIPPYWGRARLHTGRYFEVSVPPVASDALILLMTGEPFAYMIPFVDSGARVIAPVSNFTGPWHDNRLQHQMAALLAWQRGDRSTQSATSTRRAPPRRPGWLRTDWSFLGACEPIRSNLE